MPGDSILTRTRTSRAGRSFAAKTIIAIAMVTIASGCWTQYRGNLAHSGNQALEFGINPANVSTLTESWSGMTGGAITTAPAVVDGVAYVGAADGRLYAFDATGTGGCSNTTPKSCEPLWSAAVNVGDTIRTSPAVAGGSVYVRGRDSLLAFDAAGLNSCGTVTPKVCSPIWRADSLGDVMSSPTVAAGTVFTAAGNGLRAFDATASGPTCSGTPKVCGPVWSSSPFTPSWDAAPTVSDGTVFVAGTTDVYGFDVSGTAGCTGTPTVCAARWTAPGAGSSPAVVDGILYLAGGTHGLAAYDATGVQGCTATPKRCAPLWTAALSVGTDEHIEPPAIAGATVYVNVHGSISAFETAGTRRGSDRCLKDVNLCTALWQTATTPTADFVSGAPALANGVLYTGGTSTLRAYDAAGRASCAAFPVSCEPLFSAPTREYAPPVIVDGTLFSGSSDGLHAFRTSPRAPAPTLGDLATTVARGQTTGVTVPGTGFTPDLQVATSIPGAIVTAPSAITTTALTVSISVPAGVDPGAYALTIENADHQLAATTLVLGGGTSGPEVAARAGVSAFPGTLWAAAAERDADTRAVADTGARWTSLDLDWKSIQSTSTDFGWARGVLNNGGFDGAVKAARAQGLQILGTITYSPRWASPDCADQNGTYIGHCLPDAAHVSDFAKFARAAVQRYGSQSTAADPALRGSITAWQIWNEPNHREFSLPRPDPDRFTAMLRAAYPAIKAADPAATVITGGTAPAANEWDTVGQTEYAPTSWLLSLYDRGAQNSFDAVGHHPYSFPWNPLDEAGFNGFTQARYLYLVMAAHGDGTKKVWGTEMGAPTGTVPLADPTQPCFIRSMTETEQAQWLHDYYLGWNTTFRAFTGPLIWKATRDDPPDSSMPANSQLWNYSGLLRLDHSPKPAFAAMQGITANGVSGPALGGHCY